MGSEVPRNSQINDSLCCSKVSKSRTWLGSWAQAAQCTPSCLNSCTAGSQAVKKWWVFNRFKMERRYKLCLRQFKLMTHCCICNSGGNKNTNLVGQITLQIITCFRRLLMLMTRGLCASNMAIVHAVVTASALTQRLSKVSQRLRIQVY